MVREISISLYLFVFSIFFHIFKLYPQKQKSTFVASFGDNVLFTLKELEKHGDEQVIILKTAQCKVDFTDQPHRIVLQFEPSRPFDWLRSIYHLATSSHIFVDNYFGFLAVAEFREDVQCTQLWHAAGAIKQFGLRDPSIQNRSARALKRFQQVYDRFTHVVVGSDKMAHIFQQSFGLDDQHMLRTGIPRTDFFFDDAAQQIVTSQLTEQYPVIQEKKVILYAPTFRDQELHVAKLALDFEKLYKCLKDDYVLFLRLHPAVRDSWDNPYPDFIYDVSSIQDVNHLLIVTDILVSDYSSIPFEFALLERPMIFFAYDLAEYSRTRGFWEDYENMVPGPVVHTTDALIHVLKNGEFHLNDVRQFAKTWNEYSTGNSSENLVKALYKRVERSK